MASAALHRARRRIVRELGPERGGVQPTDIASLAEVLAIIDEEQERDQEFAFKRPITVDQLYEMERDPEEGVGRNYP